MIYFDNAATGQVCPAAADAAEKMIKCFGNPSSLHKAGMEAAERLKAAREQIAAVLGCNPGRLIFTSGGTEANNLAILSLAHKNRRASKRIITDLTEHPSVASPLELLKAEGYEIVYIPVTNGVLDIEMLEKEAKDACLVTFMHANNQTGCLFDPMEIRHALDKSGSPALFHCDAVQSFCKTDPAELHKLTKYCDTVSISAHKIGGLKGCGALYYGERAKIVPLIRGGDQESGLRGGTENTVGIAAFGAACADFTAHPEYLEQISSLRRRFIDGASAELKDKIEFFIPPRHIDCIVNFAVSGLKSEVCLNYLSSKDICISSSSACSARAKKNTVLPAYGLPPEYTDCAVRVGFSRFNTPTEVDIFIDELKKALAFTNHK